MKRIDNEGSRDGGGRIPVTVVAPGESQLHGHQSFRLLQQDAVASSGYPRYQDTHFPRMEELAGKLTKGRMNTLPGSLMIQEAKHNAEQTHPTTWSLNRVRSGPATTSFVRAGGAEEHDSVLEVLIAHEDIPAGLRARQVLDRLADVSEIKLRFVVKLWTFRVLRDPVLHKYALNDASGAHILILSLQGGSELPPAVCALIDGWLADPKKQPRALVVSFDEGFRESGVARAVLDNLRTKAVAGGADLFPCFGTPPPAANVLPGRQLSGRANSQVGTQWAPTHHEHA